MLNRKRLIISSLGALAAVAIVGVTAPRSEEFEQAWCCSAGLHIERYVIPKMTWPKPATVTRQTSFMASAFWHEPTCIRYENPKIMQGGREIQAIVENEGTPGEPGWVWNFLTTEPIDGPVEFRVETVQCGPVS